VLITFEFVNFFKNLLLQFKFNVWEICCAAFVGECT
jgi:hypothetical protein